MLTRRELTKETMEQLIDHTNCMTGEEAVIQGIVEALQGSHRTLQQSFVRCMAKALIEYSNTRFDARNEASIDFAKKVKELEHHFPFI